jgi:Na+-transporting NADH:ubiquinone oxidoreductase subunit C
VIRQKRWFPIVYMFVATAFCGSVVIGFTQATEKRGKANEKLAFESAILAVLPNILDGKEKVSGLEMHRIFTEKVSAPDEHSGGAYTLKQDGQVAVYALPISGQGFWAPIMGIIGIKSDRKTITGIYFYQQNETPGLGAEITQLSCRSQFKDKIIADGEKPLTIARPSATLDAGSVHAVTGATQTSTRLEIIINNSLKEWQKNIIGGGQ